MLRPLVAGLMHVLQILIDNGADIEAVENDGLTPLHQTGLSGATESAEVLHHCYC